MFKRTKRIITSVAVLGGLSLAGVTASMVVGETPAFATACGLAQQQNYELLYGNGGTQYLWANYLDYGSLLPIQTTIYPPPNENYMDWGLCWTVQGNLRPGLTYWYGQIYIWNYGADVYYGTPWLDDQGGAGGVITAQSTGNAYEEFTFQCLGGHGNFTLTNNWQHNHSSGGPVAWYATYNGYNNVEVANLGDADPPWAGPDTWTNGAGTGFCY